MDIEIQTELKPKYVHVHCRGTADIRAMLEESESLFQLAASEGRIAILFDMRDLTQGSFSVMDRYDAGERVAELQRGLGRGIAFALVGNVPLIHPQKFAETVSRNRGGRFRAFTSIDEAISWIDKVAADAEAR